MSEYKRKLELENGQTIVMLYDSELQGLILPEYFNNEYWEKEENTSILAKGRSTTLLVQSKISSKPWVLRQYYRGGFVAKLIKRKYLFTKEDEVRSISEYRILSHLNKLNLPVPRPIAAMYVRTGVSYEAAILTEYVPDTQTLSSLIAQGEVVDWKAVAKAIFLVHEAGLLHADLNAHNILLDKNGVVTIIDLDKAVYLPGINLSSQQSKSLQRLRRSIEKLSVGTEKRQKNDWAELIYAYRELQ